MLQHLKVLTATAATGLAAAGVALAAGSLTDPKGDTRGQPDSPFDLRSASVGGSGGREVHRVESWTASGSGGVVLEINVGGPPSKADFMIMKSRETGKVQVLDHKGKPAGSATYKKLSSRAFSLAFGLRFAGNPPKYKWRWRVYGKNGTYDLLPNRGWNARTVPTVGDEHR